MAATGMDDDFGDADPEEAAENTVDRVFLRVLIGKTAALTAFTAGMIASVIGDYVFAVMALWLVPARLSDVLAAFTAVELYAGAAGAARSRRDRPQPEPGLSKDERTLDSLAVLRSKPRPAVWWQSGPRSRRFWLGALVRAVYSSCAALVLVSYLGLAAGLVAAAAFTAVLLAVQAGTGTASARALAAVAFIDPRPPRDTPET